MSILLTGGAGYIGSHTAYALLAAGEEVVVIDDLSTGRRKSIPAGVQFGMMDAGDTARMIEIIREHDVEAIMHFAGSIQVEESMRDPLKYYHNNVETSRGLLQAAVAGGVKHFIFSSTAAVYGNPQSVPVSEGDPTVPVSPYGKTKLVVEGMLEDVAAASGSTMNYAALRYFNVAGADPEGRVGHTIEHQPSHLIKTALAVAMGRKPALTINGTDYPTPDGTCIRDYIHVSDLAEAHVAVLNSLRLGGKNQIYNVGYGKGYSVKEVVESTRRVTKKPLPVVYGPRRAGDVAEVIADARRIWVETGWSPRYNNLDQMIGDQYRFEQSQQAAPVA